MVANLLAQQIDAGRIPLVFQYNKRDLPDVIEIAALSRALNGRHVPEFPAVATSGEGVLETFAAILPSRSRTSAGATRRCSCRRGRPSRPGRSRRSWRCSARAWRRWRRRRKRRRPRPRPGGRRGRGAPEGPRADRRGLGPRRGRRPGRRSTDSLTESYAQASAELGFVVSELREERDLLRVRLDEVRRALELATEDPGKTGGRGAPAGDPQGAREGGRRLRGHPAALHERPAADAGAAAAPVRPALPHDAGAPRTSRSARELTEPQLEEAVQLARSWPRRCAQGEPSFEAVALVPLRSAERLLGLALLYFGPYAALPPADTARAPRLPGPRARGPARGRGGARGDLGRRSAEGALAGVGRGRGLAADAPALGAGAAAGRSTCPTSSGRSAGSGVSVDVSSPGDRGARRRAAPALRLRQPRPPVRGRRAREGPDPRGHGPGRAGRRRRARARRRGRAQPR